MAPNRKKHRAKQPHNNYATCADCMEGFEGRTPQEAADKLKAHKAECPKK